MSQHSTRCFRKRSRHRLLVTAPSIHENNFVLTSVWGRGEVGVGGGGEGGGEDRNRRRTEPEAAFYLLSCTINRNSRAGPELRVLPLPPAAKTRSDWEKAPPPTTLPSTPLPPSPPPASGAAFHSGGSMWSSGPAVAGFLRSEGPSQVILGDEALGGRPAQATTTF